MAHRLRGWSFHSIKGGVGRSYLAVKKATELAAAHPREPVYLIDMDLTGTSLADGLPLCAPLLRGSSPLTPKKLQEAEVVGFSTVDETRALITQRHEGAKDRTRAMKDLHVPFFNDFLLHVPAGDDYDEDVALEALCWRLEGGPKNLYVMPTSACPGDIERILPLVNDEDHAAFVEARLETLLARLLERDSKVTVVFDTMRGLFGVGRAVLSLGLRQVMSPKEPLSEGGYMSQTLQDASVTWAARFVTSPDVGAITATTRWLDIARASEKHSVRMVVNDHG